MIDCVVVGYHEDEGHQATVPAELLGARHELPPQLRGMLRTRIEMDRGLYPYLAALSHARWDAPAPADGARPVYSVAELPNLGTLYLVNFLRARGLTAAFVNSFDYEKDTLRVLLAADPKVVAITTTFYMWSAPVIDIVRFIRAHHPDVVIAVGGPLIDNICRAADSSAVPAASLPSAPRASLQRQFDTMGADVYIWESQGEATLAQLVSQARHGGRRTTFAVPNVFQRDGTNWRMTRRVVENNNLDESAIDWTRFSRAELGPTVSTRTARSCAFSCAFCDYPRRAGALTVANLDTVERELEQLVAQGVTRVAFIDDTFNVPIVRFRELCKMLIRRDWGLEWFSYFRCSEAREASVYDLMADAGCRGVLLGIESGDDQMLLNMEKRGTIARYRYGIEQLRRRSIFVHASTVVGFPGETADSVQRTVDFLNETEPTTFTVNHWYYSHATPIHQRGAAFDLQGEGFQWRHETMTSAEAMEAADMMFREIRRSAWMPVNGLDFWGVPYLLGKGMTVAQIVEFLRLAKGLTPLGRASASDGPSREPKVLSDDFTAFCRQVPLRASRYQA